MNIQFSNSDLQRDSLGEFIEMNPEDIITEHDDNLEQSHILTIKDTSYFYLEEHNRDHDRDLAMGLLLQLMQNDDGVQILALDDSGNEFMAHIEIIERDTDGSIYAQVTDQDDDCFCIPITELQADGHETQDSSIDVNSALTSLSKSPVTKDSKIVLGDYVETTIHGHRGRVSGIVMCFRDTNEDDLWFNAQSPAYDKSAKNEKWYSILVNGSGYVLVAESRVKKVTPFKFTNPWADEYFSN